MKSLIASVFAVIVGFGLLVGDAEAKRLGGGKSLGMQRESVKPATPAAPAAASPSAGVNAAPVAQTPAMGAAGAAAAAAPKRSWLGPVAGLAAGLGLAALASHLGFGEGLANFMMILLLVMAAFFVFRLVFRRRQAAEAPMRFAGANGVPAPFTPSCSPAAVAALPEASGTPGRFPAGFDVDGFTRQAKLNFIRMQAANDAGNLDDLREFTSPEMFAEIKLALAERGSTKQETDVAQIEAEVLEVVEEGNRYIVSVHFRGLLREEGQAAAPFDEIWHLTKPLDGSRGWVVAGIQQTH